MERQTTSKEISLSSHLEFINWVAHEVSGIVNHYKVKPFHLGPQIPDVCVMNDDLMVEAHEIEVVRIPKEKIGNYSVPPRPKTVLWIALPDLKTAFDEVRVICHYQELDHLKIGISVVPSDKRKETLVYIKCQDCKMSFNSLEDWEKHFVDHN